MPSSPLLRQPQPRLSSFKTSPRFSMSICFPKVKHRAGRLDKSGNVFRPALGGPEGEPKRIAARPRPAGPFWQAATRRTAEPAGRPTPYRVARPCDSIWGNAQILVVISQLIKLKTKEGDLPITLFTFHVGLFLLFRNNQWPT